MKKRLLIGVIFLISSISLIIYYELKDRNLYNTNIHDITNSASKEENIPVYLNATFIAGSIKAGNNEYFVIFGDGVQYLVKIDSKKILEINKYLMDNPEENYKIVGITKLIPLECEESGIKFVNNYLNSTHGEDHEHNITKDDFYHYFGYVYLDTVSKSNTIIVFIILTGITGLLLVMNYVFKKVDLL